MNDALDNEPGDAGRQSNGRFRGGESGNPRGRPAGSRNKTTLAAEAMLEGEAEALTRKVIELAKEGDLTALRLCLDRILPSRRERLLQFELPSLSSAADAPKAIAAITVAVSQGEITLTEATEMAKLIETFTRAFEASEMEERLRLLEDIEFLRKNKT
jgi:hypothetical protein